MKDKIKIGIIGGSGFTGLEIVKILSMHKYVEIKFVTSRTYKDILVSDAFPSYMDYGSSNLTFIEKPAKNNFKEIDLVFLCLPPLKSMEFLKEINYDYDFKVIDVGSDFRIKDPDNYRYWYGTEHVLKDMLQDFTYGLPELNKNKIKNSQYVANPGCYPTSVLLGLAPVLKKSGLKITNINIDSKSGVTGAGRKLKSMYLFSNMDNNFYAYSANDHRHIGEIEQEIENLSGKHFNICFTPHLLPINRGIFSSIYCKMENKMNEKGYIEEICDHFKEFYKDSPFIKFTGTEIPQLKDTVGTNMCLIGLCVDSRTNTLKIFSAIDNLVKGAAGQAVQNMNIMMGFDEKEGLISSGIFS